MTAEEAVRSEHQRQGMTQVSVANAVSSLRLCSEIDWREFVERVSLVEHALRRDPAGVYARMDFLSRDEQRHAVEQIAAPNGEAQVHLALRAVESARQAAARGSIGDRAAHVGYHLVGPRPRASSRPTSAIGRRLARASGGSRSGIRRCCISAPSPASPPGSSRWSCGPRGSRIRPCRSSSCSRCCSCRRWTSPSRSSSGWSPGGLVLAGCFVSTSPTACRRARGRWSSCRRCSASVEGVAELLEHLEVLAQGNRDPHIHFAILE